MPDQSRYISVFERRNFDVVIDAVVFLSQDQPTKFSIPICKSSLDFNLSGRTSDLRDGMYRLFHSVAQGDVEKVKAALMPAEHRDRCFTSSGVPSGSASPARACHPLCRCPRCRPLMKPSSDLIDADHPGADNTVADDDDMTDGVTLLAKDDRGFSALHVASLFDQTAIVELLIDLGALVNAADHYGRTPLHLACMRGCQKAVSVVSTFLLVMRRLSFRAGETYFCLFWLSGIASASLESGSEFARLRWDDSFALFRLWRPSYLR